MTARLIALIPAHLASVRFPRKVLQPIRGLPMVEHVRRRAAMVEGIERVAVATGDEEVVDAVSATGGSVIRTSGRHTNGTECVAEAAADLDATHILLIQGDEPLLLPRHVEAMVRAIREDPGGDAWNATGPIDTDDEIERRSVVKALVGSDGSVLACSRRYPSVHPAGSAPHVRKVLGLIAYSSPILRQLTRLPTSPIEQAESIEQMRLIEHGHRIRSVPVEESTPSVNEPDDLQRVLEALETSPEQRRLLAEVLKGRPL